MNRKASTFFIVLVFIVLIIVGLLIVRSLRHLRPDGNGNGGLDGNINFTPSGKMQVFGVAQNLIFAKQNFDYLPYIIKQKEYTNSITLNLVFDEQGNIIQPTEDYLGALEGYEYTSLALGREIWESTTTSELRKKIFSNIKEINGFENIDTIGAIDEPYLGDWTPEQLENIISEVKREFPSKKVSVNFNRRGFYTNKQGPNAPIPDSLEGVSFDLYPCNFEVKYDDETAWKAKIREAMKFFKSKTDKDITYVAQGFSMKDCPLTKENIVWSYQVAEEEGAAGIYFWFSEKNPVPNQVFNGYTKDSEIESFIEELGKKTIGKT